ncbi:type II toxin-antitoxin system VapC family toxin [Nostoc sp.]|uniref:type II toxin-antitoxin system VapC family toxin n=1 Tax=Nostoc sp. TaxID=1180 RepID=UPI002FF621B8
MRVLIDTNVVLDFLQEREPFVEHAARLFERIDVGEIAGFIAATTITNIYYIVRRAAGRVVAQDAIIQVLSDLNICAVDLEVLEQALVLNFEDSLQSNQINAVVSLVYAACELRFMKCLSTWLPR